MIHPCSYHILLYYYVVGFIENVFSEVFIDHYKQEDKVLFTHHSIPYVLPRRVKFADSTPVKVESRAAVNAVKELL